MDDNTPEPAPRRLTISFVPPAVADLDWLVRGRKGKQTDVVNRAVQVYAYIERQLAEGKKLAFISPDGSTEIVTIL